jgi:hypothetical protein
MCRNMANFYIISIFFCHFFLQKQNIQQGVKFLKEKNHHKKIHMIFSLIRRTIWISIFFIFYFSPEIKIKTKNLKIEHFEF